MNGDFLERFFTNSLELKIEFKHVKYNSDKNIKKILSARYNLLKLIIDLNKRVIYLIKKKIKNSKIKIQVFFSNIYQKIIKEYKIPINNLLSRAVIFYIILAKKRLT